MLLFIIVAIIFVSAFAVSTWKQLEDATATVISSMFGLLIALLVTLVLITIGECVPGKETYEMLESKEICAMNDSVNGDMHYFLFSGYSDSELTYRYLYKGEFGYEVGEIDAEKASIIFSDTPKVEEYERHFVNPIHDLFCFHNNSYRVYVPEGTIAMQQYNVDLQ